MGKKSLSRVVLRVSNTCTHIIKYIAHIRIDLTALEKVWQIIGTYGNVGTLVRLVQISFPRDATLSNLYFISYRITLDVSGALCAHHQEF
jgi:hypothetical protein